MAHRTKFNHSVYRPRTAPIHSFKTVPYKEMLTGQTVVKPNKPYMLAYQMHVCMYLKGHVDAHVLHIHLFTYLCCTTYMYSDGWVNSKHFELLAQWLMDFNLLMVPLG